MFISRCLVLAVGIFVLYIQGQQVQALNQLQSVQANNTQYLEGRINNVAAELSDFEYKTKARLDVFDARTRMMDH